MPTVGPKIASRSLFATVLTTEITHEPHAITGSHPAAPRSSEVRFINFGPIQVDLQREVIRRNGSPIRLSGKAYSILLAFLERPGEIVTRESLYERLWPSGLEIDRHSNLSSTIKKLRRSLGDSRLRPLYIETVTRRGYRFVAHPQPSDRSEEVYVSNAIQLSTASLQRLVPGFQIAAKPGFRLVLYILGIILIGSLMGAGIWMTAWISYRHHAPAGAPCSLVRWRWQEHLTNSDEVRHDPWFPYVHRST